MKYDEADANASVGHDVGDAVQGLVVPQLVVSRMVLPGMMVLVFPLVIGGAAAVDAVGTDSCCGRGDRLEVAAVYPRGPGEGGGGGRGGGHAAQDVLLGVDEAANAAASSG